MRCESWAGFGAEAVRPSVRLRLALEAVATGRELSASEVAELEAAGWGDATRAECQAELWEMARVARAERRAELDAQSDAFAAWAALRSAELRIAAECLGGGR